MVGGEYVRFLRRGDHYDRVMRLQTEALRWRWLILFALSDQETFPGLLVSKGLTPLTDAEIVNEVYKNREVSDIDRPKVWANDRRMFIEAGLLKTCFVDGNEYLWNVDFHVYQDKYTRKSAQINNRFYHAFPRLQDKQKVVFVLLLSKLCPQLIDLSAFFIPEFVPKFDSYLNAKYPLFNGGSSPEENIKPLLDRVTERVSGFIVSESSEGKSEAKEFVNWYCKTYLEVKGSPYMRGGKDYGVASDLLKVFSITELKTMATRFLNENTPFAKKVGYTIGVFRTMVNRLVMQKDKRPIGVDNYDRPIKFEF